MEARKIAKTESIKPKNRKSTNNKEAFIIGSTSEGKNQQRTKKNEIIFGLNLIVENDRGFRGGEA